MVIINIYEVEEKEGKNGMYFLLETDLGGVFVFPNDFDGDFDKLPELKDKKIEGGVTCGKFQKLKKVDKILGEVDETKRPKDKDKIISRIACVNSAVKILELVGGNKAPLTDTKECVFKTAEEIFEFINK